MYNTKSIGTVSVLYYKVELSGIDFPKAIYINRQSSMEGNSAHNNYISSINHTGTTRAAPPTGGAVGMLI